MVNIVSYVATWATAQDYRQMRIPRYFFNYGKLVGAADGDLTHNELLELRRQQPERVDGWIYEAEDPGCGFDLFKVFENLEHYEEIFERGQ